MAMLTARPTEPSQSGTSVSRDFVELPSQLYHHWLTVPAVLEKYARHYKTGEPMPRALLDKMLAATHFRCRLPDGRVHLLGAWSTWPIIRRRRRQPIRAKFEAETLQKLGMPSAIVMRVTAPAFRPCLFGRRLFSRLLFLHVVGGARCRRVLGLRGDRRSC